MGQQQSPTPGWCDETKMKGDYLDLQKARTIQQGETKQYLVTTYAYICHNRPYNRENIYKKPSEKDNIKENVGSPDLAICHEQLLNLL